MVSRTKRTRDAQNASTSLNLASATQTDREFTVQATDVGLAGRFLGFTWKKTTAQIVTFSIIRRDVETNDEYTIETATDAGELDGTWRPHDDERQGSDVQKPTAAGSAWVLRCSQTAGACALKALADFQEA